MEQEASFFGDYRLDQASRFIHDRLVSDGPDGISVRRLGGNRAGEVRLGRFLRNGKVTEDRIIEPAAVATSPRVGGLHVLSIQDTTSFRDDGRGTSLVGHATIAVKAEQGSLLGLLDAQLIERREDDPEPSLGRSFRDRQCYRWMSSMKRSEELLGDASMVTVVTDPFRTGETDGPTGGLIWFDNAQASPEPGTGSRCSPHAAGLSGRGH